LRGHGLAALLAWRTALATGLFVGLFCAEAAAQIGVEGTIRWADGTPAAGLTVTLRNSKAQTVTDESGRYKIDKLPPGVWAVLDVAMGKKVVGHGYGLLTQASEKIDIDLVGTIADPAPRAQKRTPRQETVIVEAVTPPQPGETAPASGAGGGTAASGRGSVIVSRAGVPTLEEEVVVTAPLPMLSTSTEAGKMRLSPEQVESLPSLGTRDIFRALQLLPGVANNETSSGLSVRGGTPDQNLVSYDGFTVYSVDHLFGYFSAFNMDAVEAVELSKGSYEARHGGRLSSLTEIRGKSNTREMRGMVGASLLNADGAFEFPIGSWGSFLVAARQSYQTPLYDRILGLVNRNNTPRQRPFGPAGGGGFATAVSSEPRSSFNDFNARIDLRPTSRDQVAFSLYQGNDDVDNSRELQLPAMFLERLASRGIAFEGGFKITDVRDYANLGASAQWNHDWNTRIKTTASVSHSTYDTSTDRSSAIGGRQGSTGEFNTIEDWTVRIDTPIRFTPSHDLTLGVQHTTNEVRYGLQNAQGAPSGPFAGPGGQPIGALSARLDRDTAGELTSVYAQHRAIVKNRLIATPGVRVTQFSLTDDVAVEPRISATFLLTPTLRLKGAWGLYHQYVNRLVREDVLQGNREFWALADGATIPVSSAINSAVGGTYETGRTLFDVELFSRELRDISQLAPRVTGSTDGVDLGQFFYTGTGRVRGLEAMAQRKIGRHTGWASYTLSRVTYDFPDLGEFIADHDRTHELKLVDTLQLNRWTLSATWIFSTGRPYTEPVGTTATLFETPFGERAIERIEIGEKNGVRLPNYHRLDVAANYSWPLGTARKGTVGVSVFNAYNRQNVWYKEFTLVEGEVVENEINLMNLTLNAFFTIKF
jgi:ferric enterobactin receptor